MTRFYKKSDPTSTTQGHLERQLIKERLMMNNFRGRSLVSPVLEKIISIIYGDIYPLKASFSLDNTTTDLFDNMFRTYLFKKL